MRRITNFSAYVNVLPYASEIFGVYQPLLGWRSKRSSERFERGFANDRAKIDRILRERFEGEFVVDAASDRTAAQAREITPARLTASRKRSTGTFVSDAIASELPPLEQYDESVWKMLEPARLKRLLADVSVREVNEWAAAAPPRTARDRDLSPAALMAMQLQRESLLAGYLSTSRRPSGSTR